MDVWTYMYVMCVVTMDFPHFVVKQFFARSQLVFTLRYRPINVDLPIFAACDGLDCVCLARGTGGGANVGACGLTRNAVLLTVIFVSTLYRASEK